MVLTTRNNKIIIDKEKFLALTFALFFYAVIIVDIFRLFGQSYMNILDSYTDIFRNIVYILIVIMSLITLKWYGIKKELLYVVLGFLLLLGISIFLNDDILKIMPPFIMFFVSRCLPGFYLGLYIKNYKTLLYYMDKFKLLVLVYCLLIIKVYSNLSGSYSESSYMAISYNLLQAAMVILICGLCFKKKYYFLFHAFIIFVILVYGARGTLVCLFTFYTVVFFLLIKNRITLKKLIYIIGIIIIGSGFAINIDNILMFLGQEYSFSRNLSLINADSLLDFSNRALQYEAFMKKIGENPFKFRGILSDRFFMGEIFKYEATYNVYPHNIILECLYQFGIIVTISLASFIIYRIIKKIYMTKGSDNVEKCMFALFIPVPFIYLMFSGSYLISYTFWMALGYLLRRRREVNA